ncbi:MAG: lysoplasmalogenase [Clostridia bacterium]|nr:lysoplasmalogenase [Clostridia bacterium]MBQ9506484.1 lysoplasmalogenase [Clostridia bacterium]MBR5423325.1 lysoplasmalogenase [Clostridia bacterium]
MQYVFLSLFVIVSVIHLIDSWRDNAKRRAYTKPFLLILLLLFYFFAAKEISWVLAAALLFSWLGDVLLIPKGTPWFIAGGIAFLVSHILFIFAYLPAIRWERAVWWILIPAALLYYGISVTVTLKLKGNIPVAMIVPMILYLLANSTMNLAALTQLMTLRNAGAAVAYAGAVFFFISDCTLYLVRYHTNKNLIFKKHFTVMLTYLLGECLITVGLLMI